MDLCTSCDHKELCKYSEEFRKAQQSANEVRVSLGDGRIKMLRDFDYIEPIKLSCKHWKLESKKGGSIR